MFVFVVKTGDLSFSCGSSLTPGCRRKGAGTEGVAEEEECYCLGNLCNDEIGPNFMSR